MNHYTHTHTSGQQVKTRRWPPLIYPHGRVEFPTSFVCKVRQLYMDHNRFWQKVPRPALFYRQDPGDRHHVLVRNGLLTDWQIPHRDRELWHSSSERERGRDGEGRGGRECSFASLCLSKGGIQWELHWREWAALSVCDEGWTEDGRGEARGRARKTMRMRRRGKRGNFSVCIFQSKTFWQGRAHSVAGRGGAILKSPTGSLRDAGSQNRYISGLPRFFFSLPLPPSLSPSLPPSLHTFLSCFLTASSEPPSRCLLIFRGSSGTVHTNTPTLLINR